MHLSSSSYRPVLLSVEDVRKGPSACWSRLCLTFHGPSRRSPSPAGRRGRRRAVAERALCNRLSRVGELPQAPVASPVFP